MDPDQQTFQQRLIRVLETTVTADPDYYQKLVQFTNDLGFVWTITQGARKLNFGRFSLTLWEDGKIVKLFRHDMFSSPEYVEEMDEIVFNMLATAAIDQVTVSIRRLGTQ